MNPELYNKVFGEALSKVSEKIAMAIDEEIMKYYTDIPGYERVDNNLTSNPLIKNHKIGKFKIANCFLGNSQPIFEKVLIVRCEFLAAYNAFEYYAYSEAFRSIPPGEMIPEYIANIFQNTDDPTATFVTFEEVL